MSIKINNLNQLTSQNQDKLKTRLKDKVTLVSDDDTAQLS